MGRLKVETKKRINAFSINFFLCKNFKYFHATNQNYSCSLLNWFSVNYTAVNLFIYGRL